MPRKQNYSKKYIDDTFKPLFFDECVINLIREDIEICNKFDSEVSEISEGRNEMDAFDDWRGLGENNAIVVNLNEKPTERKKQRITTYYMDPVPEIKNTMTQKTTRSNLNSLLINGNITTPLKISKQRYLLYNTCPFDSIAVIITMAYIDNDQYKQFIDTEKNELLQFCKDLGVHKSSKIMYLKRLHILKNIFDESDGITNVKIIDARCNITYIIARLLKYVPSAIEELRCSNIMCINASKNLSSPTIILNFCEGFKRMNLALNKYIQPITYHCTEENCDGTLTSTRFVQKHLFIETEVYADSRQFSLNEFPTEICLNDDRYIFCGVVSYGLDHYVAVIRRVNGNWEVHNDLQKKISKSKQADNKVNPHLVVYIKQSLKNTPKEDGNTSKQNNISIDEEPVKKKQKLDTNEIDGLKSEFRELGTQFKPKVKSSLRPNYDIASTSTEEVPIIDCATESVNSYNENAIPKICVKNFDKLVDEEYLCINKVIEAKPPVNGKTHVKWNLIEIEKLHNEYFSKSVQVNIVTISNILNVISMSNEYFKSRLDESNEKKSEAEKIKHKRDACRLHERYKTILETKLKIRFTDITSSFKESEFYSAFIMFFLSILTVLRVLDQMKFGNFCQELFEIVKQLLPKSLTNNECNHPDIFATFQSIAFYSDCMNVLSVINDSRDTDPGVTDRMPLYFLKTETSQKYFKTVINAVTSDSNEDLSLLIENATFQCFCTLESIDPVVSSTVQQSNYNIPATKTIHPRFLSKNQAGTYSPLVQVTSSSSITSTLIAPATTCGTFQQKIQNKITMANSYPHIPVFGTMVIDNKQYQLVKEPSGQMKAVLMPNLSISPLVQGTASSSDNTTSTPTITTRQSVNGPSDQMTAVDNDTLISPPTIIIRCDEGHCDQSATITCKCRKVNYCSDICRKRHWYVHYKDHEEI